jgi:uncharacterized protein YecT (DUF1311 family)
MSGPLFTVGTERQGDGMMHRTALLYAVLAGLLSPAAGWAQAAKTADDKAIEACGDKSTTADIVECLDQLTQAWDTKLNAAYRAALKTVDPEGVTALRAAERAWLAFRDQRCRYLSAGPGTIKRIIAANCVLTMTRARAEELAVDSREMGPQTQ